MPEKVQFSNGNTSEYLYDASGVKRRATYKTALNQVQIPFGDITQENLASNVSTTTRTDYDGSYIYENGALSKVLTPEGYIAGGNYHYFEKDHLGNTRVVLKAGSTVQVAQVTDYYPFGMEISDPNRIQPTFSGSPNPYLYNGKEMDRMHGLNMLDYGARWYDASLGRWGGVVDPLAEKYYWITPYAYCLNNPLKFVDADGRAPGDYFKTINGAAKDFGKFYNGKSILRNKEFGSSIYVVTVGGQKRYAYTVANEGLVDHVNPSKPGKGKTVVADIHSHGKYLKNYGQGNEEFSPGDKWSNYNNLINGYLTTPEGSLKKYDIYTGETTVISQDLPSDPSDPNRKNKIDPSDSTPNQDENKSENKNQEKKEEKKKEEPKKQEEQK